MAKSQDTLRSGAAKPEESALAHWPRFAVGIASAVYALATLALAWPALAGKFLVSPHSDQYIAGFAFRDFAAQSLRSGNGFPQWNPYLFGGMPFIGAMHGDIFYPTFLLRLIMPTDAAMTLGFAIHLFLAGLFAFLFLRASFDRDTSAQQNISLGFAACLIGGLAYMLGGQISSLVSPGHDGKLFVSALFPLGLWALIRGVRDGRQWAWGAFALVVGLAVLSPHPQLLQYMLLSSGAYAIFLAVRSVKAGRITSAVAVRRLAFAFGAVLIGGAIGAIQYLPVREYVPWSPRAGGLPDYSIATSYAWNPEEIFNVYLPQFSGILENYWGRNVIHLHSEYMGAGVLMLMGAAWLGLRASARRSQVVFWSVTLVIALLWAMGSSTPFYRIPYAIVPGTKFFRAPQTVFFVGSLAIAFLAAVGTERLLGRELPKKYLIGWAAFALMVALFASIGGLSSIAMSMAPEQTVDRVVGNASAVIAGSWRSAAFVLLTIGLIVAYHRKRLSVRLAGYALAAIVSLDLWTVIRSYWIFSEPASTIYASDGVIEYLKKQPQPGRVLTLPPEGRGQRDPNLTGDGLMVHGVRIVLGYHGNELGRYDQLSGKIQGYTPILDPLFWRLTNTQYVMTDNGGIEQLQKVAGPARNPSGNDVYLYKTPGDNPFAWVTPAKIRAADLPAVQTLMDRRFDPLSVAIFDSAAAVTPTPNLSKVPAPLPITVTTTSYAPGRIKLKLDTPAPEGSALVVSENYFPGWRATSGGRNLNVGRADFVVIGVELPAGATEVELSFHSAAYDKGKMITLIALGASILLVAAGVFVQRRSAIA
ncbi:MAG: hypothetical protein H0U64_08790 [Gemmatimonadaceae bacterium]|nr:hypothetical protein [Gemmatimonadaceae bacterium]